MLLFIAGFFIGGFVGFVVACIISAAASSDWD